MSEAKARRSNRAAALMEGEAERSVQEQGEGGSVRLGNYLRRLREGYGYTLRRVEERASSLGESIDNSQLSRFEKGRAVPSFDKLRALARVFNVSVQSFSDVLDLEVYEPSKPDSQDFDGLLRSGESLYAQGDFGRAFVTYERALEVAEVGGDDATAFERKAEARWRMATALKSLGKLAMTERELREILKMEQRIPRKVRMRTLLQLSHVYRELSDLFLAKILARECLELAMEEGHLPTQAAVLNTLGNIHDVEDRERAVPYYRRALELLERLGGQEEWRTMVLTNLGGCLAALHRAEEGMTLLREAHSRARQRGFRRVAALSMSRLAEVHILRGEIESAGKCLTDSDALASRPEPAYQDILFLNAYRRWELARQDGHATREKIAFGRLRHLRSLLERKFPEVDDFDRFIEGTRRNHEHAV